MARPLGAGEDPCGPAAAAVSEVVAATAACLLVRRSAFEAVGGFDPAFDYGLEDVDLCLRLVEAGGTIRYDGRTALWHHESATRVQAPPEVRRARVEGNRRHLVDRWGPRLTRDALLDAIAGGGRISGAPLHVGITLTRDDPAAGYGDWYTGHELGDALAGLGWRVSYLERFRDHWYEPPADMDVLISLIDALDLRRIDRRIVTVAWVRNWPDRWRSRPWYDDHDLVLAGSAGLAAVLEADAASPTRRMPIATNPARFRPVEPDPALACDVLFVGNHFGGSRGVAAALPALAVSGLRVRVHGRGWEEVPAMAPLAHGFLDYERLPAAYAAAGVVVDDTAHPTRPYGAVNSRLFDAVAAGAVVITDNAAGARELFGVDLPAWSDAADLEAGVRTLLADRPAAEARMAPAREAVLAGHTYAHRATEVRDYLLDWVRARRIGIRIGPPDWDVAPKWGDLHFGRALQKSLQRAGHPTRIHLLPDWDTEFAARDDATIHLFGLREARNRIGQANLLWQISHPDLASGALYDTYDAAFVASDRFAAEIAARTRTPVRPLHQATDPERFRPTDGGPPTELLYVANARRDRPVVRALGGTDRPLAVYGRGWTAELLDPRHLRGEHLPNAELAAHYAAAAIVLNDHWADMRDWGFLSNRLYDALACGACVVSDRAPGLDVEFDGAVPTYGDPNELVALVDALLADPDRRRVLGERGRAAVLARHTFELRTAEILEILAPLLAARPGGLVAAGGRQA
jgi:spore maturation protein CgeB